MNDEVVIPEAATDSLATLRIRTEQLERKLLETEQMSRERLVRAELKVAAVRVGIIDLDGLKLLDTAHAELTPDGELANAEQMVARLRQDKPWLFGAASSSSMANPPPAQPPRHKLATEMTEEEYRTARTALLKRRP